jgi:hypothetical protein
MGVGAGGHQRRLPGQPAATSKRAGLSGRSADYRSIPFPVSLENSASRMLLMVAALTARTSSGFEGVSKAGCQRSSTPLQHNQPPCLSQHTCQPTARASLT